MFRYFKLIVFFLFMLILTSCSIDTVGMEKGLNDKENVLGKEVEVSEQEVSEQALAYFQALQNDEYENAFNLLSEVYINAGVSIDDFEVDLQQSNIILKDYSVEIINVRDRKPDEKSQSSKGGNFCLVNVYFDSKGETKQGRTKLLLLNQMGSGLETEFGFIKREESGNSLRMKNRMRSLGSRMHTSPFLSMPKPYKIMMQR